MALTCAVVRAVRADTVIGSLSGLYVSDPQGNHVFNEQLHGCKLDLPQAAHMLHRNTAHHICRTVPSMCVYVEGTKLTCQHTIYVHHLPCEVSNHVMFRLVHKIAFVNIRCTNTTNTKLVNSRTICLVHAQPKDVVLDLAADQNPADASGWFRYFWDHVCQKDILAMVSRSEQLMQIHTTAEQFDPATEQMFKPLQVSMMAGDVAHFVL